MRKNTKPEDSIIHDLNNSIRKYYDFNRDERNQILERKLYRANEGIREQEWESFIDALGFDKSIVDHPTSQFPHLKFMIPIEKQVYYFFTSSLLCYYYTAFYWSYSKGQHVLSGVNSHWERKFNYLHISSQQFKNYFNNYKHADFALLFTNVPFQTIDLPHGAFEFDAPFNYYQYLFGVEYYENLLIE